MKVAVIPNLDKRGSSETVEKLGAFLKKCEIEAYLPDNICCADYNHAPEEELYKIADVIITIGGDGTIIRYAKRAARDGKAVLGINAGRVGYLANIEQNEYNLLSKLKTGEYTIEERMMLNITVKENGNSLDIYYNTDLIVTYQISDKFLNYKKEYAKEILKSDALKNKTEKEIEDFIEKNLSNMDMLLE